MRADCESLEEGPPSGAWPLGHNDHAFDAVVNNLLEHRGDEWPWWVAVGELLQLPTERGGLLTGGTVVLKGGIVPWQLMVCSRGEHIAARFKLQTLSCVVEYFGVKHDVIKGVVCVFVEIEISGIRGVIGLERSRWWRRHIGCIRCDVDIGRK